MYTLSIKEKFEFSKAIFYIFSKTLYFINIFYFSPATLARVGGSVGTITSKQGPPPSMTPYIYPHMTDHTTPANVYAVSSIKFESKDVTVKLIWI